MQKITLIMTLFLFVKKKVSFMSHFVLKHLSKMELLREKIGTF